MLTINLRDFYPWCNENIFVEITDEMVEAMKAADRQQEAYRRRMYYHNAQYSLDAGDGIENDALFISLSPCELYEHKLTMEQLSAALCSLPGRQGHRVYAYYILGVSQKEIAKAEGVSESAVCKAIERGLKNMEKILKVSL